MTTNCNDIELLLSLKNGERSAFEQIFNRYWSSLYDAAYKRLKDKGQCKDIIQDVFADLWIRREKVRIENLEAYLHTAIRFQIFKNASRNKISPVFIELYDSIASSPYHPGLELEEKELEELAQVWIDSLPEKRRMIFQFHFREHLSTKEIAEKLGISQKTVQNQLGTASRDFRDQVIGSALFLLYLNSQIQ